MAFRLFGTVHLAEPTLTNSQMDHKEQYIAILRRKTTAFTFQENAL